MQDMRDESTSEETIVLYRPPVRGIAAGLVGVLFVAMAVNWSGDLGDGWLWLQLGLFGLVIMIGATVLIWFVGRIVISETHLRFQNTIFTFTSVEVGSIRGIHRGVFGRRELQTEGGRFDVFGPLPKSRADRQLFAQLEWITTAVNAGDWSLARFQLARGSGLFGSDSG